MDNSNTYIYQDHFEMINNLTICDTQLRKLITTIQDTYTNDQRPWIIGFSGGKDSTCVLSLIYSALLDLPADMRSKPVYVVSSDTLVETPVVVDLIDSTLETINQQAKAHSLPISAHKVIPPAHQTFWTNLLGRGYPAPTKSFRWCTERMKIDPVGLFIKERAEKFGEIVLALGSRRQESATRAGVIKSRTIKDSNLSRNDDIPNSYSFLPIVEWSADDVWQYLMSAPCPWGGDNQLLFDLYKGSNQGECPLVVDKSTPSCGNSRFGCWTCTVVTEDKALHGLIESGEDWMKPLLDFRNKLYSTTIPKDKKKYRNHKRRSGKVHYLSLRTQKQVPERDKTGKVLKDKNGKTLMKTVSVRDPGRIKNVDSEISYGPYWLDYRKQWLKELLILEKSLFDSCHAFKLISEDELQAIRQEWLRDPNEPDWEDSLPKIYADVYGENIDWIENDAGAFTEPDAKLLKTLSKKHHVPAELVMKLMEVELSSSGLGKRSRMSEKLETVIKMDWESLDDINLRNLNSSKSSLWEDKLEELRQEYDEASLL